MSSNPFTKLLYSRKFWLAMVALVQTVLFQFVPDFPANVWQSIDAVLAVLIAAIAVEDAAAKWTKAIIVPMSNPFTKLLYSRKFWLTVVALVQTVLFQFVPDFPAEVWQSINAVLVVLITAIAVEDAAAKAGH